VAVSGSGLLVTGVADPGGVVAEANESNNVIVQSVVIQP